MASTTPQAFAVETTRSATGARRGIKSVLSYKSIGILVGTVEVGMITLGSAFGQVLYQWIADSAPVDLGAALGVGLLSSLLYILASRSAGLYGLPSLLYPAQHLKRALTVCAFVLLSLTAMLFLLKIGSQFSRGSLLGFAAAMLVLCCLTRIGAAGVIEELLRRDAIAGRPAFVVGDEDELATLSSSYLLRHFGVRETGRLAVDTGADHATLSARMEAAMAEARAGQAKEFIVATKWDRAAGLHEIERALRASPLPARLVPQAEVRTIIGRNASPFAASSFTVELQRAPMGLAAQTAKRALDIVVASFAIVALMPVFMLAGCAVKLDSAGPIIFRQRRNGFDRRQFVIFKFRTMRVLEDGAVVRQARRDDDRITMVGRFLRRTSIDELPQLFNVLRGDMSLVGPRPHALAHDQEFTTLIGDYCMRHHVKPGITGWAQIKGCRGETSRPEHMQRRVDLDLWYIKNWSIMLDVNIMARTALDVIHHDAY